MGGIGAKKSRNSSQGSPITGFDFVQQQAPSLLSQIQGAGRTLPNQLNTQGPVALPSSFNPNTLPQHQQVQGPALLSAPTSVGVDAGQRSVAANPTGLGGVPSEDALFNLTADRLVQQLRGNRAGSGLLTSGNQLDSEQQALSQLATTFGERAFDRGIQRSNTLFGQDLAAAGQGEQFQQGLFDRQQGEEGRQFNEALSALGFTEGQQQFRTGVEQENAGRQFQELLSALGFTEAAKGAEFDRGQAENARAFGQDQASAEFGQQASLANLQGLLQAFQALLQQSTTTQSSGRSSGFDANALK